MHYFWTRSCVLIQCATIHQHQKVEKTFRSFLDFCTNFPIPSKWLASKRSLFFPARQKKGDFFLQKPEIDPFSVGSCVTGRGAEWIEKGGYEKMSYKRTGLFIYQNTIDTTGESPNISTTPITAMGCWQCLSLSVFQLKGKHCQKPHRCNGVVDTFGPGALLQHVL